jgi:hypothetical protein
MMAAVAKVADKPLGDIDSSIVLDYALNVIHSTENFDAAVHTEAAHYLAMMAQKDMVWKTALEGPNKTQVLEAFRTEKDSLESTVLVPIKAGDELYQTALEQATSGRWLLDVKRSGAYKARGVKQGFKEDKATADGPDFNYYAHVAKLTQIRASLFRNNRGNRRIAVKDVSTAFLQSDKYPEGIVKYLKMKNPVNGQWEYWQQLGPIYGESSAPARWEGTISPWLVDQGFDKGDNAPCVFYHGQDDLLLLLYVDDLWFDGDELVIHRYSDKVDQRFKCKALEFLAPAIPIDYVGMDISMDTDRVYLSMAKYTRNYLKIMNMENVKPAPTPIVEPIDSKSEPLDPKLRRSFMTGLGCIGWLVNTGRPDLAYAHSRASQHMANPTISAWNALVRMTRYLKGTITLCISAPLHGENLEVSDILN